MAERNFIMKKNTIKRTIAMVSAVSAIFVTNLTSYAGGMECPIGSSANINITNAISDSIINGNLNVKNKVGAAAFDTNAAITNILNASLVNGNVNFSNKANLAGYNVTSAMSNVVNNAIVNGNLNIDNISKMAGKNITAAQANIITNYLGNGTVDIKNVMSTFGSYDNFNAAIQNVLQNAVSQDVSISNFAK